MKILETDRLILRRQTVEDADFLLELWNDPSWIENIRDFGVRTVEEARKRIASGALAQYAQLGYGFYVAELKDGHVPIGICGFAKRDFLEEPDVGFAFLPRYWGKGYAYEAAAAVMEYGKSVLGFTRVAAFTSETNEASGKLLEKLGLRFEKLIPYPGGDEMVRLYGVRNEMNVSLVEPTADLQEAYMEFYQEWVESGEDMIPWVIRKDPTDFSKMLQELRDNEKTEGLPEGRVPDTTYWLVTEDRRVVGAVNIRHALTEFLFNCGGHIGYGIRPSERRKGYATRLLALSLEKARELGISKALVVCDAWNLASERTIRNNGGVEDVDFIEEDGNVNKRFWIELEVTSGV